MRRQYTTEERAQIVALVMSQGVSVPDAAAKLGVHASTAYHWVKQAKARSRTAKAARPREKRKAARARSPSFVRLVQASQAAAIEVQVVGATIRVTAGFDVVLLREVVEALRGDAS